MKSFKRIYFFAAVLLVFSLQLASQALMSEDTPGVTFAMCSPSLGQVKNIEQMFEKDVIPLRHIKVIGVYHEDEVTDYKPAYDYVKENQLSWMTFETIKGKVDPADLFKENDWTGQFKAIFANTSGIIFTGGADIPPSVYGDKQNLLTQVETPTRSFYEVSFLLHLLGGSRNPDFVPLLETRPNYVVLGICLGCQTMNIACGGTLYQDIPTQIYGYTTVEEVLKAGPDNIHSSLYLRGYHPLEKNLAPAFHRIELKEGSLFVARMKMKKTDRPYVLTSHHQALEKLGKDLLITATSLDGKIIEAIEHRKYKNVLGIQFHPEPFSLYMKGLYYRKGPGESLEFNLRYFLEDNPPAMEFHKKLWQWFSQSLQ